MRAGIACTRPAMRIRTILDSVTAETRCHSWNGCHKLNSYSVPDGSCRFCVLSVNARWLAISPSLFL